MKQRVLHLFVSMVSASALLITPLSAVAEGVEEETDEVPLPRIIITEVQTSSGPGGATREFIEIYNTTDEEIIFGNEEESAGWQLWYLPSSRTLDDYDNHTAITLTGSIAPQSHILLAKGFTDIDADGVPDAGGYLAGVSVDQEYTLGMASAGNLWLTGPDATEACRIMRYDALGWGTATIGEGVSIDNPEGGTSLTRLVDADGAYIDTARNSLDFTAATEAEVTPAAHNTVVQDMTVEPPLEGWEEFNNPVLLDDGACEPYPPQEPPANPPSNESPPSIIEPPEKDEDENTPVIPAGNIGLKSPQLSELLPNPGKPQTDANDEFVEIYNPNDKPFDLSGYVLETGTSRKHRHTFPDGTLLKPKTFLAVFSGDTSLTLTNSNGLARFIDPLGNVLAESAVYESAKDNQAWVNANGKWQWTAKPTPNAVNVVQAPASKEKTGKKKSSVKNASSTRSGNSSGGSGDGEDSDEAIAATTTGSPLHPGLLALVGGFALLYGAYEYRHDIANKIRKFRTNRTARSASGQGAKGR